MSVFAELKRRNVHRAAGAYIGLSWLVLQVGDTLFEAFGLDSAILRTVVIVLAIGFVPMMVAAWAFELTASGIQRDRAVDRSSADVRVMDRRLDRIITVVLALALAYFAVDKFVLDPARDAAREQEIAASAAEALRSDSAQPTGEQSKAPATLAVLPFTAVGGGEESEFFALGVHDDLLTRMAQLKGLRVISRTSVMEYKDTQMNLRDVGAALGADAILEGGVQTAGNRIRINAQLIEAATDEHLWAETYDRELTTSNIFDVQAEIAKAIALALQATLQEGDASDDLIPTSNMAAYRAFHEAMALRDTRGHDWATIDEYTGLLRRAIALDPNFRRPAAELVGNLSYRIFNGGTDPALYTEAEQTLADLQARAPDSVEYLIAQSYYTYYVLKDYPLAHALLSRAHTMAPGDVRLLLVRGWIERRLGDYTAKLETDRLMQALDPGNAEVNASLVLDLVLTHHYDEALGRVRSLLERIPPLRYQEIMLALREHGDAQRVAEEMAAYAEDFPGFWRPEGLAELFVIARDYSAAEAILTALDKPSRAAANSYTGYDSRLMAELRLYWAWGRKDELTRRIEQAQAQFDAKAHPLWGIASENGETPWALLPGEAFLAALRGEATEAQRLVRRWMIESTQDRAERVSSFEFACDVLGISGAAEAAVECIRKGLDEPSFVTPFLTTVAPYYDPVRDAPIFVELQAELDALSKTL